MTNFFRTPRSLQIQQAGLQVLSDFEAQLDLPALVDHKGLPELVAAVVEALAGLPDMDAMEALGVLYLPTPDATHAHVHEARGGHAQDTVDAALVVFPDRFRLWKWLEVLVQSNPGLILSSRMWS